MCVLIALIIDWLFGEPPIALHPVVWFGAYLQRSEYLRKFQHPLVFGGLCFGLGAIGVIAMTTILQFAIAQLPLPGRILTTAILLKPAFAFRMLVQEVSEIENALQQDLDKGRQRLSYIVSRNTAELSASEVRESALESISENLSDSVIAPLFWFLLFGLPGAYLYRFVNTADAMWGYRNEKYEYWGKIAARSDDLLNWIPARITGLALLYLRPLNPPILGDFDKTHVPSELGVRGRFHHLRTEAHKTPSPNSGWSMAAFALRLHTRLSKPNVYTLNPTATAPTSQTVTQGIQLATHIGWIVSLVLALLTWKRHAL
jgi:adenosylcobinamide-phosphate synthase